MNFAYLDGASILESLMRPIQEPLPITPCQLDDTWVKFEEELGEFKMKYVGTRADLAVVSARLREKRDELNVIKMMLDNVNSQDLKDRLQSMVEDYEESGEFRELSDKCASLGGEVEAMKKVLTETNAERYGKFTCFVCMDRLVDLFIEPCGHVMCERCWARTPNKQQCPGCRVSTQGTKKIFTMN
jgi:hypothetical protein